MNYTYKGQRKVFKKKFITIRSGNSYITLNKSLVRALEIESHNEEAIRLKIGMHSGYHYYAETDTLKAMKKLVKKFEY